MHHAINAPRPLMRIIRDALQAYFYPVTRHFYSNYRIEKIYDIRGGDRDVLADAYEFAGEVASVNQRSVISYIFSLAERHKALRLAVEKRIGVEDAEAELIRLMNSDFFSAVYDNFHLLHKHFNKTGRSSPHISIRGNWRSEDRECIITIFRDRQISGDAPFALNQSTSISYSARTGRYYLCNDIPRAVIDGSYKSPRLKLNKANEIVSRAFFPFRRVKLTSQWSDFWVGADIRADCAYRSNLTVPILIENAHLSDEVLAKFKASKDDKIIFGFLCFDHDSSNFFDEKIDIPVAKTISDMISIFAFQRLRFTDYSRTFQAAEELIAEQSSTDVKTAIEDMNKRLRDRFSRSSEKRARSQEESTGERTVLLSTDELLVSISGDRPLVADEEEL